jgi:hypothetical protein
MEILKKNINQQALAFNSAFIISYFIKFLAARQKQIVFSVILILYVFVKKYFFLK